MPPAQRLWDSDVILAYLAGAPEAADCRLIIQQAERGEFRIAVTTMAEAEVAYLQGVPAEQAEARILEFFSRPYVVPIAFDRPVAQEARRIIRMRRAGVRAADVVQLAACVRHGIPILETFDEGLHKLDRMVGKPPIIIRRPLFEGTRPLLPPG